MINIKIGSFVPLCEVRIIPKIGTFTPTCGEIINHNSFLNKKPFVINLSEKQSFNLKRKLKIKKLIDKL
jgi:hypothetical protein